MNKRPQENDLQQLHTDSSLADLTPQEETYSLEDIMNEFGGWSKKKEPEPEEEPVPLQAPLPTQEPVGQQTSVPQPEEVDGEQAPPMQDWSGDTIRFAPIASEPEKTQPPKIWTYKGEPDPIPAEETASDEKAKKKAEKTAQKQKNDAQRRQKKIEQIQRRQARKEARRKERPERVFASVHEAYSAYSKRSSLPLRLLACTLLSVGVIALLILGEFSFFGIDFTDRVELLSKIMLALMLLQALFAYDIFLQGMVQIIQMQFDQYSLLLLMMLLTTVDAFFAIASKRVPFCAGMSVQITMALWAEVLLRGAKRRSLKAACSMNDPVAAVREEKAWHGLDCIFRSQADANAFAVQLELPDAGKRVMRVYVPVITLATLCISFFTSIQSGENFLWAWAAMLSAAFPTGILVCYARPFALQAKRLMRAGCAVAGWYGARQLGGECAITIEDADLFPPENVTLNGMKIYSNRSTSQIIGYATAVVETAGSGLVPLFDELMRTQNGRHYSVDVFRRYEGGGLGAEIRGDVVLMGSIAFMKLMKVQIPEGTKLKQAVYLSINSELAAVFALTYAQASATKTSLLMLARSQKLVPILATRDFMITPQFLKQRYKLSPDRIEFPTVEERARLSSSDQVRDGKQGAMMVRNNFSCFASAVCGARALRNAAIGSMVVSIIGGIMGMLLLGLLTFIGANQAVSAWNLFVYCLLWLFPAILMTGLLGKN